MIKERALLVGLAFRRGDADVGDMRAAERLPGGVRGWLAKEGAI
jgi:hypothetical protein